MTLRAFRIAHSVDSRSEIPIGTQKDGSVGTQPVHYLLVSGVPISKPEVPEHSPFPDYLVLRSRLHPTIIDPVTVRENRNPLVRLAYRWLGPSWAVALATWFVARREMRILATGEDVGLPLALFAKLTLRQLDLSITCHNIATRRPAFYLGRLRVGTHVRSFECLSRAQGRMLADRYGVTQEKIRLLLWHVDHRFFQPDPDVPVQRQICSAGMARRDYRTLVEAIQGLDVAVKIAADSPWFREKLNISESDLPGNVEARSYGTYEALRHLYAESLFVVVPLHDVPYSAGYTVILEAMAMGKAVIVSRIQQCDDFVEDGVTGYHVPPGNVEALRERIRYLLEHPEEARRMGASARASIERNYTLAHYVERLGIP